MEALKAIHFPEAGASIDALMSASTPAHRRLIFEEFWYLELGLELKRRRLRERLGTRFETTPAVREAIKQVLPFHPTAAQKRVLGEIVADMKQPQPMRRLLQGDVGSGKTIVAMQAALVAIENGFQAALMAPTEILATQHFLSARKLLAEKRSPRTGQPYRVTLLTGSLDEDRKREGRGRILRGETQLAIGTHALIEEKVEFAQLGLVIVDEQHRFGVQQRLSLREKGAAGGASPHQLIMTATPIPRTLAMTAYADLDVSVIDELPPGRTPVKTVVLAEARRDEVVQRIRSACLEGRQAYWVCPLIDESEEMPYQAAEETAAALAAALPELKVGLVHGRMPAAAKEGIMRSFKDGKIQLLVATTVIEVGVDVPNATLMVIENAERLGLAQLHQLRGRVGRGQYDSSCLLLYRAPLSPMARERLAVMRNTNDGFEVARRDLALRGPGELLGTRQTGLAQLRVADLARDADLLPRVQSAAETLLRKWPQTVAPLIRRWVGLAEQYGRVG
jgi:ATP-dependent DNA helicase RecG